MDSEIVIKEIRDLFERMGFGGVLGAVESHQGATNRFSVQLITDANMLIGERGSTLAALEYILKRILRKKYLSASPEMDTAHGVPERSSWGFTLDINDYRMKQLEDLKQDVKTAAREVRLYRKDVPLRFMSSFERRIVHLLLAEYPDITTESVGQEPSRRVIIKPYP